MKKYFIIIATILIIHLCFLRPVQAQEILYDTYEGKLGIEIRSYSPNWKGEKLKQVYKELLNNAHGKEIKYLSIINLYPDNPYGGEEEGLYHGAYQENSFLNHSDYTMKKNRIIDLFNMKEKNEVKDIARTLSHEYGHHFTLYYLIQEEGKIFGQWQDTYYAKIRDLTKDKRVRKDYNNGHQWNITEIAAEDYVQLFGSPNAKISKYYDDIIDRAEKQTLDEVLKWNNHIFNVYPQENMNIPLANDVPNLRQYWEEMSTLKANGGNQPPISTTAGLTQVRDIGYNKKQYILQWTESIDQDSSKLLYTVAAFDESQQQVVPIKTVKKGEKLRAVLGSAKIIRKNEIIFYSDTFIDSTKSIFIFIMDEQGNIVSSNPLNIDFSKPVITDLEDLENNQKRIQDEKFKNASEVVELKKEKPKRYFNKILDFIGDILGKLN